MSRRIPQLLCAGWCLFTLGACCNQAVPEKGASTSGTGSASTGGLRSGGTTGSANQVSPCGLNAELCDGGCAVTLTDPDNCGGCGVTCGPGQACVGGSCAPGLACAATGLVDCGGRCVDPLTDDQNCAVCGHACPTGTGCSTGFCVPSIIVTGQAPQCTNGGPPITVQTADAGETCTGDLAQVTFRWALCACDDVTGQGLLYTDSWDSLHGPYADGGIGGSVGANESVGLAGPISVGGSLWTDSDAGFTLTGAGRIGQELHDNGSFTCQGLGSVGADALVNGDVSAEGILRIGGTLYVPAGADVSPAFLVSAQATVNGPVTITPPCDCATQDLVDVAGIVAYGTAHNDDAALGLDPGALDGVAGGARLDLPCGNYYLTAIDVTGTATIGVHGHTALYVGGDVAPSGGLEIALDPTATLDVFVGGNLSLEGESTFGSTLVPSQTRVYVAGSEVNLLGNLVVAGNFYAPYADVTPGGNLTVFGSLFAGSYEGLGASEIHYDSAILSAGQECADAGPSPVCASCRDCGNQACIGGTCGPCTQNSDCCAPLLCEDGMCGVIIR